MATQNKNTNIMIGKSNLHVALAQSFKRDIETEYSKFYYYLSASNTNTENVPVDSISYEMYQRRNMFVAKQIMPFEVSLVTRRYNWIKDEVYAEYDDISGGSVLGIDVTDIGKGYFAAPKIYIGSSGSKRWIGGAHYDYGDMVHVKNDNGEFYFICISNNDEGTTSNDKEKNLSNYDPTLIFYGCGEAFKDGDLTFIPVSVFDGDGEGAFAETIINERLNVLSHVNILNGGKGYKKEPSVTIVPPFQNLNDENFTNGTAEAIIKGSDNILRDEKFYVVTEDLNVYKCINNNNNSPSTIQPYGTSNQLLKLADGYIWLYMYSIDHQSYNRFMNNTHMPIIDNKMVGDEDDMIVKITNGGRNYDWAKINVVGDGYLKENPYYLEISDADFNINEKSKDFSHENLSKSTITFESPHLGASKWTYDRNNTAANRIDVLGKIIKYGHNFYKVLRAGSYDNVPPRHTSGTKLHKEVLFEYYGSDIYAKYNDDYNIKKIIVEKNIKGANITSRGDKIPISSTRFTSGPRELNYVQSSSGIVTFDDDSFITEYDVVDVITKDGKKYNDCQLVQQNINSFTVLDSSKSILNNIKKIYFNTNVELDFYFVNGYCTEVVVVNQGSHMTGSEIGGFVFKNYKKGDSYKEGNIVNYKGNDYICIVSGSTDLNESDINTSDLTQKRAVFENLGKSVTFSYQFKAGGFYRFRPKMSVGYFNKTGKWTSSDDLITVEPYIVSKSNMILIPEIDSTGVITDLKIVKHGYGYTYANLNITTDKPGVEKARAEVIIYDSLVDNKNNDRRLITKGEILNIKIITRGINYNNKKPPLVVIEGDGSGATAIIRNVDIDPRSGAINRVTITNYGKGYSWANVRIIGADEFDNGGGALARAVISPCGGHGSNPVYELFGDSVMLYTDLNNLEYDVFPINTAFRSSGLIKNPRDVSNTMISGQIASTAWKITLNNENENQSLSSGDVLDDKNGNSFVILNVVDDNNKIHLLINDNNKTNFENIITLYFNDIPYDIINIVKPTLDNMSGELLTIDNTTINALSDVENAILRTLIEF